MNLEDQLRRDEGEVLHAYSDSEGYLTIGVGILIDQRRGGGITKDESTYLLRNRIAEKTAELEARIPWCVRLDPVRKAALLNMAFQLGVDGVLGFPRMLACLRDERWAEAESHALDSDWARHDTPERAKRVARQLASGEWQ